MAAKLGNCPDCGKNMDFVGKAHHCVPQNVNKGSATEATLALINTNAAYQAKWRHANIELNRSRAKQGMRKLRAQRANA